MLQSSREEIHENFKCVAQPYKMRVVSEVGRDLCYRDREFSTFRRELGWRMVKMVRNASGMANVVIRLINSIGEGASASPPLGKSLRSIS